jgi:CubicO group peptidase (beta-lactamase class C family)
MKPTIRTNRRTRTIATTSTLVFISIGTACSSVNEERTTRATTTVVTGSVPDAPPPAPQEVVPPTTTPNATTLPGASATFPHDLGRAMDEIAASHLAAREFVGAVVAVRGPNGGERIVTSGTQRSEDSSKVDPLIPWEIGSVTKVFVAVVVLQLVEEGRLDLDRGIDAFFPNLANAATITPRQLLQHTSGINDYINLPELIAERNRFWTSTELIALADRPARFELPLHQHGLHRARRHHRKADWNPVARGRTRPHHQTAWHGQHRTNSTGRGALLQH